MKRKVVAALSAFLNTILLDSQAQTVLNVRTLSLVAAHEAATVALEQCKKSGYAVTVKVLERLGRTQVVFHDDGPPTPAKITCARPIPVSPRARPRASTANG